MQPIAPGEFDMGTRRSLATSVVSLGVFRNRTHTRVRLTRPYWIGRTEVTQRQWETLMGTNPSRFKNVGANGPVECVSYHDAISFCQKLTAQERKAGRLPDGLVYTLPTEAQWEYASRAGDAGDDEGKMEANGWYQKNSGLSTHWVGQMQQNAWQLRDTRGNVWEWCRDWADHYPGSQATDPVGPATGNRKIARGGAWDSDDDVCTSFVRQFLSPATVSPSVGFRLALVSDKNR
jgi:formylglycine-generating enzyme required for sulfatase activity